jgi:peroxiredoxin Q/BCP
MPQYQAKNTRILGVSFDTQEENDAFACKFDFPFPLLCDTDRKIGLAYGAATLPTDGYAKRIAYLIDEEGVIREAHAKVDATTYPQTQLNSL